MWVGLTVVTQFVRVERDVRGGQLREESAQCRASLSAADYRDAKPGLVLGSGGQPGLAGEPRVQKWPLSLSLTQRGLSLVLRSAEAQDVTQRK